MTEWLAVFLIATSLDLAWSIYTRHLVTHRAGPAAVWAALIALIIGANTILYTTNPWLLIPSATGAFVGTYVATHARFLLIGQELLQRWPWGDRAARRRSERP